MKAALALALVLAPGLASAGDAAPGPAPVAPDDDDGPPIVPDARAVSGGREANLQPSSVREGFAIGVAIGPAMQLGFGVGEASGTGPGVNLRVGTVMSPRWLWLFEIATTAYKTTKSERINQSAVITFGGQVYVNDAFWLRGGGGFASFTRRTGDTETESFGGLGMLGSAGFDLLRRGGLAMSVEGMTTIAMYDAGTVFGATLQLGASWY